MKWKMAILAVLMMLYILIFPLAVRAELSGPGDGHLPEIDPAGGMVSDESGKFILDAGLIEWQDGLLTATEGFILRFEGKTATGDTLTYDMSSGLYRLDQGGFTTCVKSQAHYKILARRMELMPGKYLAFYGVQIQIGQVRIPFLPRLILPYRDGGYQFPDWLPELIYGEDGLGLMLKAEYLPNSTTNLRGALTLTTRGGIDARGELRSQLAKEWLLQGYVEYDDRWTGGIELDWRSDWKAALFADPATGMTQPHFTLEKAERQIAGISYNFLLGVTLITENDLKARHNKVYAQSRIHDSYALGNLGLSWSLEGTPMWIAGYRPAAESRLTLRVDTRLNDQWGGHLGYGRTDHWGALPEKLYVNETEEYVQAGMGFHWRNRLDEGWDVEAQVQYSLLHQRLNFGKTKVVKAYDCFDVELSVEWVKLQAAIGFKLKY